MVCLLCGSKRIEGVKSDKCKSVSGSTIIGMCSMDFLRVLLLFLSSTDVELMAAVSDGDNKIVEGFVS